ncbi:MAG: PD40 domain-containing protein [bacterium]|nr:PD40 domain-containing protein [bacterium]
MKSLFALVLALAPAVAVPALAAPRRAALGGCAYSRHLPDGATVVPEYKATCGLSPRTAVPSSPLTISESYEYAPVWSRDGRSLAPASTGTATRRLRDAVDRRRGRRLTFHSTGEMPSRFTADDKAVLFSAARQDPASNAQFPTGAMSELYSVPAGRRARHACAADSGEQRRRPRRAAALPRLQGCRESLAQAPHLVGDARHLGARHEVRRLSTADDAPGRGSQPGLRRRRRRLLLAERARRLVQRLPGLAGRPVARDGPDEVHEAPGALPHAGAGRHALLQLRRRAVHAQARRPAREAGCARGRRRPRHPRPRGDGERGHVRPGVGALGQGAGLRLPRRDLCQQRRGRRTERITDTPLAGSQPGWGPDGRTLVYAAEPDQSWNISTTSIAREAGPTSTPRPC